MNKFSRKEVITRIANGEALVIFDDKVLKVDRWLRLHPGGDKVILHLVGKDATAEINAYHDEATRKRMLSFCIGTLEDLPWQNIVPPIQNANFIKSTNAETVVLNPTEEDIIESIKASLGNGEELTANELQEINSDLAKYPDLDLATQQRITESYIDLERKLEAIGMYECNYLEYAYEVVRYFTLFSVFSYFLSQQRYNWAACFLGLFLHQVTFIAHDAGHTEITGSYFYDHLLGSAVAAAVGGLSCSWWKRNHNVHHIVTNHPEHDPDIQHMPLFAVSTRLLKSLRSTYYERIFKFDKVAQFFIAIQSYSFYFLLLFGRFNLYRLSYDHLLMRRGPQYGIPHKMQLLEMALIPVYWYWYGYLLVYKTVEGGWNKLMFVLLSHFTTAPLHIQITLSHFAMSTTNLGPFESFPQRQLRTTMDIDCIPSLDFIHGGLQFQAIHHLYPRIPRHNLRKCIPYIKEYAKANGIPYVTASFLKGNQVVVRRLQEVSSYALYFRQKLSQMGKLCQIDTDEKH